jgi:hypothetical protein
MLRQAYTQSVPDISVVREAENNNADEEGAAKVVETLKILITMLYTIKTHLLRRLGGCTESGTRITGSKFHSKETYLIKQKSP